MSARFFRCPNCGYDTCTTEKSYVTRGTILRKRRCRTCFHKVETVEVNCSDLDALKQIESDFMKAREMFNKSFIHTE